MSFYNWIQEKLFDDYEEWRLKSLIIIEMVLI